MVPTPHFSVSLAGGSGGTKSGCPRSSLPDSAQTQGAHLQCSLGSRSWARLACSLSWTKYWTPNPIPTWPPPHPRVFTETLLRDGQRSWFHSQRLHASRTQQTLKPEPCGCPTPALWTLLLLEGFAEAGSSCSLTRTAGGQSAGTGDDRRMRKYTGRDDARALHDPRSSRDGGTTIPRMLRAPRRLKSTAKLHLELQAPELSPLLQDCRVGSWRNWKIRKVKPKEHAGT